MSDGPFECGKKYKVIQSFKAFRDEFFEGEILEYMRTAYSRYDGYRGYFFKDKDLKVRTWDVSDEENEDDWINYFELVE